jgi:hypothetical protein
VTRQIKKLGHTPIESASPDTPERVVTIAHDVVNEAAVLATMVLDPQTRARLVLMIPADRFQVREHREGFAAMAEVERRKLTFDYGTVAAVGGEPNARYLFDIAQVRGVSQNVDWHVANMFWDAARIAVASGPLPAFIEALRDPRADPERVKALARQIPQGFDGQEDRRYLRRPEELIRELMLDLEARKSESTYFPFGIEGLDFFEDGKRRLSVGSAPGLITCVTAVSGSGKSTFALHLSLGSAGWRRQPDGTYARTAKRRKVMYGAWEPRDIKVLEQIAGISLGWSRTHVLQPSLLDSPLRTEEGMQLFRRRCEEICEDVVLLQNPFTRQSGEKSNERNLDILQGYIADSGCEVFVADLWERCLVPDEHRGEVTPGQMSKALERQQSMMIETRVHGILLAQQRFKDIETRADKRPTREGILGSGQWVGISDNIFGIHWGFKFKKVNPNRLDVIVLKQREGAWPLLVEFNWEAESAKIWGGRSAEYDRPGESSEFESDFLASRSSRREPKL